MDEAMKRATVERPSERELVVRRIVRGPARLVFAAWTRAELFEQWWVPAAAPITLRSCQLDVRVGGTYRLVFGVDGSDQEMAFFGRYLEVVPNRRIVWTNDEDGEGEGAVSTVTFDEENGHTLVVVHDLYPSKEALDAAIESGSTEGMPAQLEQLDALVSEL
ncbi:MAG: SRPBCC domain-containing protein [Myxococcota bacterium]